MFLIEYEEGSYIDAEKIDFIKLSTEGVIFTLSGDIETVYRVGNGMAGVFINNLQAINDNPNGIEAKLRELMDSDDDI
tara:strand:- start:247 stop:480 length:234 start_codon:yes stop_codon:yes gene_type:complete